ncbi:o-succinylbenzoic acid (OSB) synthetase [Allomuricauda ruestringensis DSM 13258]|uniref:o-succinylbenzoate synthase n=1 Tax=Allomuricauda ruestringensis (strain DSM 13258 / CIP 107369 / LMG 19739 / B1) TaxID=886377 RepID=G2PK15_ALLRU|nr:o-succinylbenzoate synthase [Allomuricauda ruestringensis]AEM72000.1 o-succinylbenzoic acid (OSB) synthetase [Allomuricauda ruestringensis DSM 13258]
MKASYKKYTLNFKVPSGTSRGVMTQKETWYIILKDANAFGIGECGILRGLSVDDVPDYEQQLAWACDNIHLGKDELLRHLRAYPSIQFGLEQALLSLQSKDPFVLFPSDFTQKESPISINGLIWMGDEAYMLKQLEQKLNDGFGCIKMKIGAIDFEKEMDILKSIRNNFSPEEIELRVDANGAFSPKEAMDKLERLSTFKVHSIEQPIKAGQWNEMAKLCRKTPLPIALDEELIGVFDVTEKEELLQTIQPQYIILKPSLVGGINGSQEWIELAEKQNIKWWITSALESNIGLNAIAQYTYWLNTTMPQGLGTGSLFTNNIKSPLEVAEGKLFYRQANGWDMDLIQEICI